MSFRRVRAGAVAAAASALVALAMLALPTPALAAAPATPQAALPQAVTAANGDVVRFEDYTLPAGKSVPNVVVIRGNATIAGTVDRAVVVIGGDAIIEGTANIGSAIAAKDSSIVVVGGTLTTRPGATVHGKTIEVSGIHLRGLLDAAATGAVLRRPIGVFWGWWQFLFLPIVALVVAGIFPRGVARVADRVRVRFWPSLGWGLLWFIVALILIVVLAITIIGLIVAIPAAFALPAVLLFCLTGVAALVGRFVLSGSERYRDNVLAAAVVGALIASLVSLVPAIGGVVVFFATMAGFGAGVSVFNDWRRARRVAAALPLAPGGPGPASPGPTASGPAPPPPTAPQPPAGWSQQAAWTPPPGWTPPPEWTQAGWAPPPGWAPPGQTRPASDQTPTASDQTPTAPVEPATTAEAPPAAPAAPASGESAPAPDTAGQTDAAPPPSGDEPKATPPEAPSS